MIQYEKNAVQKMEDFQVFSFESGGRANRLADSIQNNKKVLDFEPVHWPLEPPPSALDSEVFIFDVVLFTTFSKYALSSPIVTEGLHCGEQL